jgi:hypothetical protein
MVKSNHHGVDAIDKNPSISKKEKKNFNQIDNVVRNLASIHGFHLVNTRVVCKMKILA